jgi:regulator of sigma E protease
MHELQTALIYVVPFLLVITLLVVVHELGHFLTARAFGVAVDRFSIGFGRAIVSWRDRSGVEWAIGWLPLGGYVRFAGDENAASIPDQTDLNSLRASIVANEGVGAELKYLPFKPLWQRALVVVAGPMANFVLATVLFAIFLATFGEPVTSPRISQVTPGGPAAQAGFQVGDVVLSGGPQRFDSFQDMQAYVQYRAGIPIDFTVARGASRLHLVATPSAQSEPSPFGGAQTVGHLGLGARGGTLKRYNPFEAVVRGAGKTWDVAATTVFYLGRILTGQVGADQLHSVVGIAHASGSITQQAVASAHEAGVSWIVGVAYFLIQLAALMSVSVGLLNLLPVPTLDGGHLLFYAYELITKHPPRAGIQAAGFRAGLALLVGLMLFATWNDLQRLRVFQFVGSFFS